MTGGYTCAMRHSLDLDDELLPRRIGRLIREARTLAGWTQDELAGRARVAQCRISRLERAIDADPDVAVVVRLLSAMGMRGTLELSDRALDDRRQQRDPVHARLLGFVVKRLERAGWRVATEVPVGAGPPRGWVDLAAVRGSDGLIGEVKGDLPDVGGLQRQVSFYTSSARLVFQSLGWAPARLATLVVALDSVPVHAQIAAARPILGAAYPGTPSAMARWLEHGGAPPMPTIATADPLSRSQDWLRRTPLSGRRSAPPYADYAEAAERLRRRPRGARPRGRPPGCRSRPP
jgi:transcriptional regulator with XRE-family HTH domain